MWYAEQSDEYMYSEHGDDKYYCLNTSNNKKLGPFSNYKEADDIARKLNNESIGLNENSKPLRFNIKKIEILIKRVRENTDFIKNKEVLRLVEYLEEILKDN